MFRNDISILQTTKKLYKQRRKVFKENGTERSKTQDVKTTVDGYLDGLIDSSKWTSRETGDLKVVYRGVCALSDTKNRFSNTQPTTNRQGQRIKSPEELTNIWNSFLGKKFAQTELEQMRADYKALPPREDADDVITRKEFDAAVKKMKKQKATGMDNVPAELHRGK